MKIFENIHTLELSEPGHVTPVLVRGTGGLLLIDTGLPGQFRHIAEAIEREGFKISDLTAIILTHQDLDHIGGVNDTIAAVPSIKVYAHETEIPYIEGREKPYKLQDKLSAYDTLDAETKHDVDMRLQNAAKNACSVDIPMKDGDVLPEFLNIRVIHTPGHTSGHIMLYLPNEKAVVTGDGLLVSEGKLTGPSAVHTYNMAQAKESAMKLLDYDVETVIAYHGGVFKGNVKAALKEI